jgi:hypothetical protein
MKSAAIYTLQLLSLVALSQGDLGLGTPKIDVHTHIYPGWYGERVIEAGYVPAPDNLNAVPVSKKILDQKHPEFVLSANLPPT